MKKLLFFLIVSSNIICIYPQIDTTVWIPYQIGNYWEYKGMEDRLHFSRMVLGDTIRTDGLKYFVIKETNYTENTENIIYRRVEDGVRVYNHNSLLYNFSLTKDENWKVYPEDAFFHRRVCDEGEEFFQLTNQNHEFKEFEDLYTDGQDTVYIERKWEKVYKGIGEVILGEWGGHAKLVKAKIGNEIFNSESLADYFPLHIGDKWLYKTSFYDIGTTPNVSYHWKEVVGDSLMDNGKNYFIIEEYGREYFERFDSTSNEIIRYYDNECGKNDNPIYSLNFIPNDTTEWTYCDEIPYEVSYNEELGTDNSIIEFRKDFLVISDVGFRKNLGLFYNSTLEISFSSTVLIGALINGVQWGTLTNLDNDVEVENEFTLSQNYPNPFNPSTIIKFTVPVETGHAPSLQTSIIVYDILGRLVATLLNKKLAPGNYEVEFNGSDLSSGLYFYRLTNGNNSITKKMLLMK